MAGRDYSSMGVNTRLAHVGNDPREYHGFVNPPVVHASTVLYPDAATMMARNQKYTYGTHGTPTTEALATAIDALEGSAGTIVVPSAARSLMRSQNCLRASGSKPVVGSSRNNNSGLPMIPERRPADGAGPRTTF